MTVPLEKSQVQGGVVVTACDDRPRTAPYQHHGLASSERKRWYFASLLSQTADNLASYLSPIPLQLLLKLLPF